MQRMSEGFNFFADWAEKSKKSGNKKSFLAWQVGVINRGVVVTGNS